MSEKVNATRLQTFCAAVAFLAVPFIAASVVPASAAWVGPASGTVLYIGRLPDPEPVTVGRGVPKPPPLLRIPRCPNGYHRQGHVCRPVLPKIKRH